MELWVFGYGSLIWDPGFVPAERQLARLEGYRRSFCMTSIHYRGSAEAPGLVLALEKQEGALCQGVAFRVRREESAEVLALLRARELISSAYDEQMLKVTLSDGREVAAVAYVIVPGHVQHCGGLSLEEQAQIIARAAGERGPNRDYLHRTAQHLAELSLRDPDLDWLDQRVRRLTSAG